MTEYSYKLSSPNSVFNVCGVLGIHPAWMIQYENGRLFVQNITSVWYLEETIDMEENVLSTLKHLFCTEKWANASAFSLIGALRLCVPLNRTIIFICNMTWFESRFHTYLTESIQRASTMIINIYIVFHLIKKKKIIIQGRVEVFWFFVQRLNFLSFNPFDTWF